MHIPAQRIWTSVCANSQGPQWDFTLNLCKVLLLFFPFQIFNLAPVQLLLGENTENVSFIVGLPVKECPPSFLCVVCCFWHGAQGLFEHLHHPHPASHPSGLAQHRHTGRLIQTEERFGQELGIIYCVGKMPGHLMKKSLSFVKPPQTSRVTVDYFAPTISRDHITLDMLNIDLNITRTGLL